ncbi:MAG: carbohydrate kinase [Methylococcales bacterium]|nr:carbohydrate kinase [Methylococcales bacterium]
MPTIAGIGEILWDMLPDGKQLGGAPANFAYHAKALGLKTVDSYILSVIGNDLPGKEIHRRLADLGINHKHLHVSNTLKTGTVSVTLDKQGFPDYNIEQNVAWDFIPEIPDSFRQSIDVVCFGTLAQRSPVSRKSITDFLSDLPTTTLKIFDINLRQSFFNQEIIESSLKLANIFKLNEDELNFISNLLRISGNEEQRLKLISQRYNSKLGILTKGSSGSILFSEDKTSIHPGFKVESKDTVGAGDAFTAAIAIGLLKGFELDTMNNCANQVASYVCSANGATPDLPKEIINLFY